MSQSPTPTEPREPAAARDSSVSSNDQPRPAAVLFLIAGLLGGAASNFVVNRTKDHYQVPEALQNVSREDAAGTAKLVAAEKQADSRNLMLTVTLIGMIVASAIGAAAGVAARSYSRRNFGLAIGLIFGAGLGYASARFGPPVIGEQIDGWMPRTVSHQAKQTWRMSRTIAVHAALWGAIGVAAALAVTLPTGNVQSMVKSSIGALAAGALAMMLYHVLLANAFGLSRFELLLPDGAGPVAAWTLLPAALLGLAIGTLSVPDSRSAG